MLKDAFARFAKIAASGRVMEARRRR